MNLDSAVFYSNSIDAVIDFYTNILGLDLEFQEGDNFTSFFFENGVRLSIKKANNPREIIGAQTVYVRVTDIINLYKYLKAKRVTFIEDFKKASWGTTFSILDPDKNRIEFIKRS